jgi:hypothetical protein
MENQMSKRTVEQLRGELRQIDDELVRLSEQEREAERGIDALALRARRGDGEAERQIVEHEKSRAAALNNRRRLQAARASIEAEIKMAVAAAERDAVKAKARKAKDILATLRKRGAAIETGLRNVLADYAGIQADMAMLADLGMTRINPELVKANCRRAFRASLTPIRTDLEMTLVPPLERRSFGNLVGAWSGNVERTIGAILNDDPQEVPAEEPADPAAVVGQAPAET